MHSGVSEAVGYRGFAKTEHRFDLSMESNMYGNSKRKTMHLGINRAAGQRGFAKTKHRFDLSMESKMYGNSKENYAFGGQWWRRTARIRKN